MATNVVASRPPNGDRLQRRPLVPIENKIKNKIGNRIESRNKNKLKEKKIKINE